MDVVELIIQHKYGSGWPIVAEFHQVGEFLSANRKEGLLKLSNKAKKELIKQSLNPLAYGTILGKTLFIGNVRDALMQARAKSSGDLRLLLVVEDPELRQLHWETLCAPIGVNGKWAHLALDQRVLFSHYLPSLAERHFSAIGRRDLHALVIVANAPEDNRYGLERFDERATVDGIRKSLGEIPYTLLASVEDADGLPTLNEICQHITLQYYTIVHMVVHGWYRATDGETTLYLLGENGEVAPVTTTRFIEHIDQLQGTRGLPHLVFLSTCESAAPEAEREGALGGVAQRLVRELGIPAVVAMTKKVTVPTATLLANTFYGRLRDHGEADRALVEAGVTLADEGDITVPALYSRLGGRPIFSDNLDRELTDAEIDYGLGEMKAHFANRAPVLMGDLGKTAKNILDKLGADRDALSESARSEWEQDLTIINTLCEEVLDLNFRALALGQTPPAYYSACPFPGLAAFQPEDRRYFFGRENVVEIILRRIESYPFLGVLGASGSGKSSLVLAGLVPEFQKKNPEYQMVYMTPGENPDLNLKNAIGEKIKNAPILLVVDQFEELYTTCRKVGLRKKFIDVMIDMINKSVAGELDLKVVLTMRADFWGECAQYPRLKGILQQYQELIAPMTASELRSAMEQQAAVVGLRFEAGLSHAIWEDVEGEPGAMPLLQHLLREIWKRRHGKWLLAKEYRNVGGIQKAIAQTAEEVLSNLIAEKNNKEEKEIIEKRIKNIFIRLAKLDENSVLVENRRDTRKRVSLDDLVSVGGSLDETKHLVSRLADTRLVQSSLNETTQKEEVEVTHEALIRNWVRLVNWLDDDRTELRLRESITESADEWAQSDYDDSYLVHRGSRLEAALELSDSPDVSFNRKERDYLDACVIQREKEKQRADDERMSDLSEMGWGVIFPNDVDRAIIDALRPLLNWRKSQAKGLYKEFSKADGYRYEVDGGMFETGNDWITRHGVGPGTVDYKKVPYYLLIIGDPEQIPFEFQYQLSIRFAVGRLHFESVDEYSNYAKSVIAIEQKKDWHESRATFFGPAHPDDRATKMSSNELVMPLANKFIREKKDWEIDLLLGEKATRANLAEFFGGEKTPALLFVAGHSVSDKILCQGWLGPKFKGAIPKESWFTVGDLAGEVNLLGLIAFLFGSGTAGTPKFDNFSRASYQSDVKEIAPKNSLSKISQILLGNPNGGALALIGHIDRVYAYSFSWDKAGPQLGVFESTLSRLLNGYTIGLAMEAFNQRYAEIASYYSEIMISIDNGIRIDPTRLAKSITAMVDARNWIIVGDPAVRLKVRQGG